MGSWWEAGLWPSLQQRCNGVPLSSASSALPSSWQVGLAWVASKLPRSEPVEQACPSPLPRAGLLGPVAQIPAEGAEIRARRTSTPLPFTMAYTNPAVDLDVSEVMERTVTVVEGGITQVGGGGIGAHWHDGGEF